MIEMRKRLYMTIWCLDITKAWIISYALCHSPPNKPNTFILKQRKITIIITPSHFNQKKRISFSPTNLNKTEWISPHSQLQQITKMERKKPDKLNYALPISSSDYYQGIKEGAGFKGPENMNETLFFKYASSIIQVVPQDKLQISCSVGGTAYQRNAVFQISQVQDYEGLGTEKGNSLYQESNNYNNIAAKMKKKAGNKKLLAYNFSNITLFSQKINKIIKRYDREFLDSLRYCSENGPNSDYNKTKKEIKRASFYSGYTTSTSNQERIGKRQSKKLTEEKRKEILITASHQIKGCIEFKIMLNISQAFSCIAQHAASCTAGFQKVLPLGISQVSTIKNQPLENFYLTKYQHDHSISIAREVHHDVSQSLVYTADHNFQFTQKEVTLTTPQKFNVYSEKDTPYSHRFQRMMKKVSSQQESIVESYKSKECNSLTFAPIKEKVQISISQPLRVREVAQRRYLTVRTNIYELPLLADNEFVVGDYCIVKDKSVLLDPFSRSQPENFNLGDSMIRELSQTIQMLKLKPKGKKIQEKVSQKIIEKSKSSDKWAFSVNIEQQELKKVVSSNNGPAFQPQKLSIQQKNHYFLNQNANAKIPERKKAISPPISARQSDQKMFQQIKSVESINNVFKSRDNTTIRFDESVVNQFTLHDDKRIYPSQFGQPLARPVDKKQEKVQVIAEKTTKQQQRIKSKSKLTLMQPSRGESPRVNVYQSPPSARHEIKQVKDQYLPNNPYFHNQRTIQPAVTSRERIGPPTIKQQNTYQLYQGVPYAIDNTHRMPNQVKQVERERLQPLLKTETPIKNSPAKAINPNYLLSSHEKRQIAPFQLNSNEKKTSFYSPQPQMAKQPFMQSPPKFQHMHSQPERVSAPLNNMKKVQLDQDYFTKQQNANQAQLRAVNFHNNYYTNGPQTARPPVITQVNRNVFQQQDPQRKTTRCERPPSRGDRINIFSNYSPLDSQLQYQQRSNNFSKNSSELSRPKSMNQKIFITLRKDK